MLSGVFEPAVFLAVGVAALDKVPDRDPDKGGQGVDQPQRPDAQIKEEKHRGDKQHGGQRRIVQLQAVFPPAQDAADQAQQREADEQNHRQKVHRADGIGNHRHGDKERQGQDRAVDQNFWVLHFHKRDSLSFCLYQYSTSAPRLQSAYSGQNPHIHGTEHVSPHKRLTHSAPGMIRLDRKERLSIWNVT